MAFNAFLTKHVRALTTVILCMAIMVPNVITAPSPVMAEGGTFPGEPFNGMQITYSISGATVTDTQDEEGFTTTRNLSGTLGTGQLTVSGSAKMGSGWDADVSATVSCGDQTDQFTTNIESGFPDFNKESFSISVPISQGATSGSFSICMTGHYNAGSRGLVVNGTFSADPEAVAPPAPNSPQITEDPPPGALVDISTLPAVDFTKSGVVFIARVEGKPIYISADPPSLPPSQRTWVKIVPGDYSDMANNSLFIGENWTVRTPSGAETVMRAKTGALYRQRERSWFECQPTVIEHTPTSVVLGRLWDGVANFYFPKGETGAQKYEVSLNRAVVGIEGTNFVVEVNEEQDTVKVIEGVVEFSSYDTDETLTLRQGQMSTATQDGIGGISSFDIDEEKANWGDYYEELDGGATTELIPSSTESMFQKFKDFIDSFINWIQSMFD